MFFWENFSTWTRLAEVTENKNAIKFRQKIISLPGKSPRSKSKHFFYHCPQDFQTAFKVVSQKLFLANTMVSNTTKRV